MGNIIKLKQKVETKFSPELHGFVVNTPASYLMFPGSNLGQETRNPD
jgi:hypothetical protein